MEKLLEHVESWANKRHAFAALALVSFTESSFFPIPPFVLVFAMLVHEKKPSWIKVALVGTCSSVLGGLFGYLIGSSLYSLIGVRLIELYGLAPYMETLAPVFGKHVFFTILLASITPIPYKIFTIAAGVFHAPLLPFIAASVVGRGLRFFTVAFLSHHYGVRAKKLLLKQKSALIFTSLIIAVVVSIYFVLVHYGIL